MREIKFRAWDTKKQMMSGNKLALTINTREWRLYNKPVPYLLERNVEKIWEGIATQRYILMQYTGLKDKNGKDLYESDIIQDEEGDTYLVYWNEKDASFRCDLIGAEGIGIYDEFSIQDTGGLIIGNQYENPELLKS